MTIPERKIATGIAPLIERYFCEYLLAQRNVSPQTISSYRDTLRLFLRFTEQRFRKAPVSLNISDFDAPQMLAFLDYLEKERNNGVRSRNQRLAAIRSFLKYASLQDPTALVSTSRSLAIPVKRFNRRLVSHLSRDEMTAVLNAPSSATWNGLRDRAMLANMYNIGTRVSEIIAVSVQDLHFGPTTTLRIQGKGRKERVVPLWKTTARELRDWLRRIDAAPYRPLFPNRRGERLTRTGVRSRLDLACAAASVSCPSFETVQYLLMWFDTRPQCIFFSPVWT
jgi:integrase/recombinase XerD